MFELAARLIAIFYAWTHNYAVAIGLVAVVVMLLITPLTLKSTKGMLEMQRLQPEMRRLQAEFKGDRQKMNEAMMKMYQEHKVNPLAGWTGRDTFYYLQQHGLPLHPLFERGYRRVGQA